MRGPAGRPDHRLCDAAAGRGVDTNCTSKGHNAVAAPSPDAVEPTNALVAERAHLMLKAPTAVANGAFDQDDAVAKRRAERAFRGAA
jgi:hypothetical protein